MRKYICPFCGKGLDKNGIHHIYKCEENKDILTKDEIKIRYIKHNFGETIVDDVIKDYTNNFSLPMLLEKYGINYKSIYFILKQNNIPIRGSSESAKLISQEKYKRTCLEKYGVENVSQMKETKDKKCKTFKENYGIDNICKLSSYNKRCAELHPESHEEHMKKLYDGRNKYFENATKEELAERTQKMFTKQVENGQYNSKLELRLCKIFEELNISYTRQFHLKGYIHPYDFHLCDTKILIEVNGDFWHANPLIYEGNDIVKLPGERQKAMDVWKRDEKYIKKAENCGYKVIVIWEHDMNRMDDDSLKTYLLKTLNNI